MDFIDKIIYTEMKDKLFEYLDEDTNNRVFEGVELFVKNYIETNNCEFLANDIFKNKVNEIIECLTSSDYLGNMIIDGYYDPEEVAFLKPNQLYPEKYKKIIDRKAYEHKQKKTKGTSIFTCKKCKQSNCNIDEKQSRRADESTTITVECLECGFKFRYS